MGENHFWVTTVPRTGSMWTFNVVRGLAQMAGRQVHPETVPIDDHSMFEIYHRATATDHVSQSIYTYKVHGKLGYVLPESKYLTTIRDPREIIVSFMRFMKVDFENAFAAC